MNAPLEIEVKFHLPEPDRLRQRLIAAGATSSGRVFEKNIRFEDRLKSLETRGMLLRLRTDNRVRLTFKSTPSDPDPQFKVHREWEVVVDNFQTCQEILQGLGFHPEQVYEKWRETLLVDSTKCLIDTMPYGVFLEIEGEKQHIRAVAGGLGLKWQERILLNYLEIFSVLQQQQGFKFNDVTFQNFKMVRMDIEKYLHLLHAGDVSS